MASPKSRILACARASTKMFAGLMSRVNDSFGVRGVQPIRGVNRDCKQLLQFHRPTCNSVLQCLAFQEFHSDERLTVLFANVMNGADIGMIQR